MKCQYISHAYLRKGANQEKYYFQAIHEVLVYQKEAYAKPFSPDSTEPRVLSEELCFFVEDLGLLPASCYDFIAEFGTPSERAHCAGIQKQNLTQLFNTQKLTFSNLLDGRGCRFFPYLHPTGFEPQSDFYLPGFHILYDETDYEKAATDWLINPGHYRYGYGSVLSKPPRKIELPKQPSYLDILRVNIPLMAKYFLKRFREDS